MICPTTYWFLSSILLIRDVFLQKMAFDGHDFLFSGAWDKNNPIGTIVQGHTNLRAIQQAMELLRQNDVQPKQVVLGFGFYGRAFPLSDSECSKTGCKFDEAAVPGPSTNSSATLGYFGNLFSTYSSHHLLTSHCAEVQDIITDQKPEIIHDKETTVNHFAFMHKDS